MVPTHQEEATINCPSEPVREVPPPTSPESPDDPGALMRTRQYRRLLVMSAVIGVIVSLVSWCFLEATHWLQQSIYVDLPKALGFASVIAMSGLAVTRQASLAIMMI